MYIVDKTHKYQINDNTGIFLAIEGQKVLAIYSTFF